MHSIHAIFLGAMLLSGCAADAGEPPGPNVKSKLHPNISAAYRMCILASHKLSVAKKKNEWDTYGHVLKAKKLLDQVNRELKLATDANNGNQDK